MMHEKYFGNQFNLHQSIYKWAVWAVQQPEKVLQQLKQMDFRVVQSGLLFMR